MSSRRLPDRPNLTQLKKQAKSLLADAADGDAQALARFNVLPAFARRTAAELAHANLALHDAQSVIAREYGFASWNALRDEVEARTMAFDVAVDEFVRCATGGARERAERLLALHPGVRHASLETALVLADADAVMSRLDAHPELAGRRGGAQQWEPILYACHTCLVSDDEVKLDGVMRIVQALLSRGADPNSEYRWNWHPELPRTALWSAICEIRHLPLAELLLKAGANATDGVSAHIAGGGGNIAALELLARYGLEVNGIPGGVPPLVYMMTWATNAAGPRWLVDHDADPNLAWGEAGEAPLHVAARRWDLAMVEALVARGADVQRRRADGRSAYTVAELQGQREIADWLLAHGAINDLTPLDRFVAACTRGDAASADAMLAAQPDLSSQLAPEHQQLLAGHAEAGRADVLETMLSRGFEPNVRDKDGVTPLHRAAMGGHAEATRVLLAHGADLRAVDGMFAATPLVWAVEGRTHAGAGADHVAVARVLIAAGSPLEWTAPEGAPNAERTHEALAELIRDAAAGS